MEGNQRLGRRGETLRKAVVAATIDEIVDVGFDAASINRIAARAGVHETSIYRRWGTKEALAIDALLNATSEGIQVPDTGAVRADLIAFARHVADYLSTPTGHALLRATINAAATPDQRQSTRMARWAQLRPIFDRAKERGELQPDVDGVLVLETIVAPIQMRALYGITDFPDLELVAVVDLILVGIAV